MVAAVFILFKLRYIKHNKTIHKRNNTTKGEKAKKWQTPQGFTKFSCTLSLGSPSQSFCGERSKPRLFLEDAKQCHVIKQTKCLPRNLKIWPKESRTHRDNSEVYFWFGANSILKKWSSWVNVIIDKSPGFGKFLFVLNVLLPPSAINHFW